MTGDIEDVEAVAGQLLGSLSPEGRRKLARTMATQLRRDQARRIAAQRDPDGSPFAPRKKRATPRGRPAHPVRFLYRSGGAVREVSMKTYRKTKTAMIGIDIEVGAERTFRFDRIVRYLPNDAQLDAAPARPAPARRGAIRRRAMFAKLRGTRFLKSGATDQEVWAGFSGRVAAIAGVHQEGGRDYVGKRGRSRLVKYARRQLLGMTEDDRRRQIDLMLEHVAP